MIRTDEDALICDLAETYQIYDYKQLPLKTVAVFSYGLRENSRIKMKMSQNNATFDTMLLAGINDRLSQLIWFKTEDGQKRKNRPQSIVATLSGNAPSSDKSSVSFNSGKDFDEFRNQLINGKED